MTPKGETWEGPPEVGALEGQRGDTEAQTWRVEDATQAKAAEGCARQDNNSKCGSQEDGDHKKASHGACPYLPYGKPEVGDLESDVHFIPLQLGGQWMK